MTPAAGPPADLLLTFEPGPDGRTLCVRLQGLDEPVEGSASVGHTRFAVDGRPSPDDLARAADLLDGLLPDAMRRVLASRVQAQRVRLWIGRAPPAIDALPWEALRLPSSEAGPAHLSRVGGEVVRYRQCADGDAPLHTGLLRVLVAWADPRSAHYGPLPHAPAEVAHVLRLLRAYGSEAVEAEELPHATPAALQRRLAEAPPDILYWVGHGDQLASGGALVLQGERAGEHSLLYADDLSAWVAGSAVRLVVLSSCLTGGGGSLAGALSSAGVPAVVGMQFAVRDDAAREFAQLFFGCLLRTGDVAEAVAAGRELTSDGSGWAAAVLTLSTRNTRLFTPQTLHAPAGRFQVPYRQSPSFTGRRRELERLHAALVAPENYPVAIVGLSGIGKTQLAVEYAHEYRGFFPAGVFWVHAHDPARMVEGLASLSRFWGVPESASNQRKAELVRDALQAEVAPCLLIVDNVDEWTPLELLPVVGPCRVLVTCREENHRPPGREPIVPDRLATGDSVRLLLGAGDHPPDEQAAAREIAALVDGLPLALMLARHHVLRLKVSFSEYRERLLNNRVAVLKDARRRFITDTRHDGNIFDAIDLSCRSLPAEALSVLRVAACFATRRIKQTLLQRAAGLEEHAFGECIADLRDASLITHEEDGRLGTHELVRVYTLGCLPDEDRPRVVEQASGVLFQALHSANEAFDWREVRSELPHCRSVLELCREHRLEPYLDLLRELGEYALQHRDNAAVGYFAEALRLLRDRAEECTPVAICPQMKLAIAELHAKRHQEARRLAEEAVALGQKTLPPDDVRLPELFNDLGYVLKMQHLLDEAEPWYRKSLELNRTLRGPEHPEVASCLNNLGALLEERGDFDQAIGLYGEALAIDEAAFGPDHVKAGIRLNNMGRALRLGGRPAEAIPCHSRSLGIYRAGYGPQHLYTALAQANLGHAHRSLGDLRAARLCYAEALPTLERHYGGEHPNCLACQLSNEEEDDL